MRPQHQNWDDILQRVFTFRRAGAENLPLADIVSMATGRCELPENLDADTLEFIETVAEWEQYDWRAEPVTTSPFDMLVCWVQNQVQIVMSNLTWQPAPVAGVRGEPDLVGVRSVTTSGAHLFLEPNLHGGARLSVSFPAPTVTPDRVDLKKDGTLLESVPEERGSFHFDLPEPGIYALEVCYPDRTVGFLALALEPCEPEPS